MAGVKLEVDVQDEALRRALDRLRRAPATAAVWEDIGEYLLRSVEDRFRAEKDPEGKPWAPLSSAYKRRKKGPKILTERGRLRGSITYRASHDRVEVGTNVKYGRIHQLGGKIKQKARTQVLAFGKRGFLSHRAAGRRKTAVRVAFARLGERSFGIPARPYLGLSADDRSEIVAVIRDHLERAVEG